MMAEPKPATGGDGNPETEQPETPDPDDNGDEPDVELADINVGEEVDDAFDSVETPDEPTEDVPDATGGPDDGEGDEGDFEDALGDDQGGEDIAEAIIEGSSRLAVIGLNDEFEVNGETKSKDDLREEFAEVFGAFRLGDFGSQVAQEYLFTDEEVDPLMGFAAACMCCTAMVLWLRPDGDELTKNAYNRVASLGTGDIV